MWLVGLVYIGAFVVFLVLIAAIGLIGAATYHFFECRAECLDSEPAPKPLPRARTFRLWRKRRGRRSSRYQDYRTKG